MTHGVNSECGPDGITGFLHAKDCEGVCPNIDPAAMRVSDFDFHLPEERIALRPARPRDAARMLHVASHGVFSDVHRLDPMCKIGCDKAMVNPARWASFARNGVAGGLFMARKGPGIRQPMGAKGAAMKP